MGRKRVCPFCCNTSIFRKILHWFKETGEDIYFGIQVTNEDPTFSVGRQTVVLKNCSMDGGLLAKFDTDAEYLEEDMDFTFDDWEILLCSWKLLDTRVDTYYDKVMEGGDNESIGIS